MKTIDVDPLAFYQNYGRIQGEQALEVLSVQDPLIDATYIYRNNPDVANAGLDAATWFNAVGWKLGANPNPYFNTTFYLNQNPDVAAAGVNPLLHFELYGWREGRNPSAQFSIAQYKAANPDVAAAGVNPLTHFIEQGDAGAAKALPTAPATPNDPLINATYIYRNNPDVANAGLDAATWFNAVGWKLGANPNPYFNTTFYLNQNPDVAAAGVNPLLHFELYGWREGRNPSAQFSIAQYKAANPDVAAAGVNPLTHFIEQGDAGAAKALPTAPATPNDPLIDATYIYRNNPDVANAGLDAATWFNAVGWKLGANPNPYFNTTFYLNQNPDVAAAGVNPLLHFELYGWREGRNPSAQFSIAQYKAANPDVAAAGVNPLTHFIEQGDAGAAKALPTAPATPNDPLIDATYIYRNNPDVANAGLDAVTWFNAVGWKLGANPNPYFNTTFYLNQNPDVAAAGANPLLHFELYGWREGRNPSAQFSIAQYKAANPDVAAAGVNPLTHFIEQGDAGAAKALPTAPATPNDPLIDATYIYRNNPDVANAGLDAVTWFNAVGWKLGANPNPYFNTTFYLNQNPDVAAAGVNPLLHFELYGWKQGRDPSVTFSISSYLAANPDVAAGKINALQQFLATGQYQGRLAVAAKPHQLGDQNPLVDVDYIYKQNPQVAAAGVDATQWFNSTGWKLGANPNALFDTNFYLAQNPSVRDSGMNPLIHFESIGWKQGLDPSPLFSTGLYLSHNPDVQAAGVNPLQHYLSGGREHRASYTASPSALAKVQQVVSTTALQALPQVTSASAALARNGTMDFAGSAEPNTMIELGIVIGSSKQAIAMAQVDASGHWRASVEATALGYGQSNVYVRAADGAWNETTWAASVPVTVVDPEFNARHVGVELREALQLDARTGRDATADLQSLADLADGLHTTVLDLPSGTYTISSTIKIKSNTIIDSPGTVFRGGPVWNSTINYEYLYHSMFLNADWENDEGNEGIQFRNVTFDRSEFATDAGYSVRIENAKNILITNCTFKGNGDGTAFEAVDGATISNNVSYGSEGYAFDNWDGPKNTIILNNTVHVSRFAGISITAAQTNIDNPASGANNAVVHNVVYGYDRFGIDINSISDASSLTNTLVSGNTLAGPGTGIQVLGNTDGTIVKDNAVSGSLVAPAILVSSENAVDVSRATSMNVSIVRNDIQGSFLNNFGVVVSVQAVGASVIGNNVLDSDASYPYWLPSSDLLAAGNSFTKDPGQPPQPLTGSASPHQLGNIVHLADNVGIISVAGPNDLSIEQLQLLRTGAGGIGLPDTVSVYGGAGDIVDLAAGGAAVVVAGETIRGGGYNTFFVDSAAQSASLDGRGTSQIVVSSVGLDGRFTMGDDMIGIDTVRLLVTNPVISFLTLNTIDGLHAYGTDTPATIVAGGTHQTIHPGLGLTTMVGAGDGTTRFSERVWNFNGDTVSNLHAGDIFLFEDIGPVNAFELSQSSSTGMSVLSVMDLNKGANINLMGLFAKSQFSEVSTTSGFSLRFDG